MTRNKASIVECNIDALTLEAIDWVENQSSSLAWFVRRYRIWSAPKEPLDPYEVAERRYHTNKGWDWPHPVVTKSIDAAVFASNKDASYFKLKFL